MEIEMWKHLDVDKNGKVLNGGAVYTRKTIEFCNTKDLCDCGTCKRSHKGRPYLVIAEGLKGTTVKGCTVYFENDEEASQMLKGLIK